MYKIMMYKLNPVFNRLNLFIRYFEKCANTLNVKKYTLKLYFINV